ncbi:efflux RND transporter periplasmic adaptor subunit [Aestuariibius sp. 2305UL40-4]|uniref:efflux RND transporter periplasmic adaptor subunit n=1 Tax=Aestuariibius violaceus TaxID=3234132 RepID=UPI00345EFA0C
MTAHRPQTRLRRFALKLLSITATLLVVGLAVGAVATGSTVLTSRAEATEPPVTAALTPVATERLVIESAFDLERRFVGQVEARYRAALSFELGGRLDAIEVDEGDPVEAGAVLARLDTDLLEADRDRLVASRDALSAQLIFAESQVGRNETLVGQGFTSQERLDQAVATRDELTARIIETEAALDAVEIRIEKSVLRAPFAGRIGARNVDGGETLAAGQTILTLIDVAEPQIRVGLPLSVSIEDLEAVEALVGGARHEATLINLRPDIDPVTRTRTALFVLETETPPAFGQTATLLMRERVAQPGAWVAMDALQEGTGSVWTVLIVDDHGVVRNAAVEILHAESERAFVRGSFEDGARLIRSGAHRVTPGQSVRLTGES